MLVYAYLEDLFLQLSLCACMPTCTQPWSYTVDSSTGHKGFWYQGKDCVSQSKEILRTLLSKLHRIRPVFSWTCRSVSPEALCPASDARVCHCCSGSGQSRASWWRPAQSSPRTPSLLPGLPWLTSEPASEGRSWAILNQLPSATESLTTEKGGGDLWGQDPRCHFPASAGVVGATTGDKADSGGFQTEAAVQAITSWEPALLHVRLLFRSSFTGMNYSLAICTCTGCPAGIAAAPLPRPTLKSPQKQEGGVGSGW